jgi:hypothetical protein
MITLADLIPFQLKRELLGRDYESGRITHAEFDSERRELAREERAEREATRTKRSPRR